MKTQRWPKAQTLSLYRSIFLLLAAIFIAMAVWQNLIAEVEPVVFATKAIFFSIIFLGLSMLVRWGISKIPHDPAIDDGPEPPAHRGGPKLP